MSDGQMDIGKKGLSEVTPPGAGRWCWIVDTENGDTPTLILGTGPGTFMAAAFPLGMMEISPPQITVPSTDNFNPTDLADTHLIRIDADQVTVLQSMVRAGTSPFARRKVLKNFSAFNVTIAHLGTGLAANQFDLGPGGNLVLEPGDSVDVYDDQTNGKWVVL